MTRHQARAQAKKLAAEGLTQPAIALKLAEAGFVSQRTRAPLTNAGVSFLISGKKKHKTRTTSPGRSAAPKATMKRGSLDAIKSILKLKGMAAEERIALALLVLE